MLLTIKCAGAGADNLSWLLCKRPDKFQYFNLSFGTAYVFFTENSPAYSEACLLLEMDPDHARNNSADKKAEVKFVSERPYAASSLLAAAIAQVFGSALRGSCKERPEAPAIALELEISITNFPCRGGAARLERLLKPLVDDFSWQSALIEERFPEWGELSLGLLSLKTRSTLQDMLSQICVLLPVCERQNHFWLDEERLANFIRMAGGWLAKHPAADQIIEAYFRRDPGLGKKASLAILGAEPAQNEASLETRRHEAICAQIRKSGYGSVIDLGCGDGKLLAHLRSQGFYGRMAAMDVSLFNIEFAKKRLARQQGELPALFASSLTYRDDRIKGYDIAVLSEVLEHFEPEILDIVMDNTLGFASPRLLLASTPNREYNNRYPGLKNGALRHADHRFEFDGPGFAKWCEKMAAKYEYACEILPVGQKDNDPVPPTLLAVFMKKEVNRGNADL